MSLGLIPLLELQRDLYRMPRGPARFRQYLRVMLNESRDDLNLPPLAIMNPMAREHVPALLDALLAIDAEGSARRALTEVPADVAEVVGDYKVGLVVADDARGAWTNRFASEFTLFSMGRRPAKHPRDAWLAVVLWSSEPASEQTVREAVLTTVHRTAYILRHGSPRTLRDVMAQEGHALAMAGCTQPALTDDDREYTRAVLEPFLDTNDLRTAIECLFGDAAARTLGFTPQGLSERAGLALALHDARARPRGLEDSPSGLGVTSAAGRPIS